MIGKIVLGAALGSCIVAAASAQSLEQSLAKLTPEFRSHQVCILRGLETVRRDPALRKADRMKTSIFNQAELNGTRLTAKGGAVKAGDRWFALSFTCDLTADLMKATSFTYKLGAAIPEREWEELGLWR
jgi:hypothetical protein